MRRLEETEWLCGSLCLLGGLFPYSAWLPGGCRVPSFNTCSVLTRPCLPEGLALCLGTLGLYSRQNPAQMVS